MNSTNNYEKRSFIETSKIATETLVDTLGILRILRAQLKSISPEQQTRALQSADALLASIADLSLEMVLHPENPDLEMQLKKAFSQLKDTQFLGAKEGHDSWYGTDHRDMLPLFLQMARMDAQKKTPEIMTLTHLLNMHLISSEKANEASQEILKEPENTLFLFPLSSGAIFGSVFAAMMEKRGTPIHWKSVQPSTELDSLRGELQKYPRIVLLDDQVGQGVTLAALKSRVQAQTQSQVISPLDYRTKYEE